MFDGCGPGQVETEELADFVEEDQAYSEELVLWRTTKLILKRSLVLWRTTILILESFAVFSGTTTNQSLPVKAPQRLPVRSRTLARLLHRWWGRR